MSWNETLAGDGRLFRIPGRRKDMCFRIKDGYGLKHPDLITLIMLVATVGLFGSGIFYLSERISAPPQPNTIFYDPPDPPLRIE
jgi:hypothetical protein